MVVEDAAEYTADGAAAPHELADGSAREAAEYSASGWFKFIVPAEAEQKACHLMFRLTNSPAESLGDVDILGDRALAAFYCSEIQFATYNIGTIDAGF